MYFKQQYEYVLPIFPDHYVLEIPDEITGSIIPIRVNIHTITTEFAIENIVSLAVYPRNTLHFSFIHKKNYIFMRNKMCIWCFFVAISVKFETITSHTDHIAKDVDGKEIVR